MCLTILNGWLALLNNCLALFIFGYGVYQYIKVKNYIVKYKMASDEFMKQLLGEEATAPTEVKAEDSKRERLIALVSGGQSKEYLGKDFSVDKIEAMKDTEIDKLYTRYEARLGSTITKTIGSTFIQLYSQAASMYLPIDDQVKLANDLERDPFLGHALNSVTCGLYHRFGMFLAPLTTAVTTVKHCQFNNKSFNNNNGGEASGNKESEES